MSTSSHSTQNDATNFLSAVMDSCRDAIIACSPSGEIVSWNRGAQEIYGYKSREVLGKHLRLTVTDQLDDEVDLIASRALSGQPLDHFDTVRVRKSGEEFPAAVCGFPIHDAAGRVAGFATIERDISDRVKAANALRNALAAAQEANAAKSRFLANVSHELRTPMNAIVGMTALALEEDLSDELRDYLDTIRESSDAMIHLVNDVLDLSKFESEQFELDEVAYDLRDLIESTVRVLGPAAHEKGLELVCSLDTDTPNNVVGDPVRLRQILTNLVSNAIKFTPDGEVVVDVTTESIERNRCHLRFSVVDTGIGISERDQRRIFAPFTQVEAEMTRRYSGTGLGLTISRHLIKCFGGELELQSETGKGSRFSFEMSLPLARHQTRPPRETTDKIRGLRVLVADDNETSRQAIAEQLEDWEMSVDTVSSGEAALDRLHSAHSEGSPYDLALVDALMPGVDGFEVASQIEEAPSIDAKAILMAAPADRVEFSRRCADAGAAAYVQKPVSQSQLLNAVAQATGAAAIDGEPQRGLFDREAPAQPLRILLAEDTPANRKVVERVLTRRGHELRCVVNGREAIDAFKKDDYDLVLMDVQMPIMDGLQATDAIRAMERESGMGMGVPIIAMTAHSRRGDREQCIRAGMSDYLSKPLDLKELIHTVETSVEESASKPELVAKEVTPPTKQHAESHPTAWDPKVALSRLRDDRSLLIDMISFYEEDYPTLLKSMQEQRLAGDLDGLCRSAHSFKGLASTFEAAGVVETAKQLEHSAREGQEDSLEMLTSVLSQRASELSAQLKWYRESNP